MDESPDPQPVKTFIGGRHASPTVTVAFPFSKVANVDSELRDFVEELAGLIARLAAATTDGARAEVGVEAHSLLDRMGESD